MPTSFLTGELWSLIPSHVRIKYYYTGASQHAARHTLTHLLTHITFDPWRKILIAGEWSFDRLSLFFWQCQQCVADRVAPLSHPAKIWNWRIIVSPSRVVVLSTAILWISASLWLWLGRGKRVSTAEVKAFFLGLKSLVSRFCEDKHVHHNIRTYEVDIHP